MSDDIDDDEVLIIVLGAVIAVLVLGGGIAGFFFYRRYKSKFHLNNKTSEASYDCISTFVIQESKKPKFWPIGSNTQIPVRTTKYGFHPDHLKNFRKIYFWVIHDKPKKNPSMHPDDIFLSLTNFCLPFQSLNLLHLLVKIMKIDVFEKLFSFAVF